MDATATKGGLAVVTSFLIYILGLFNEVIVVLLFFMALDFLTGFFRGFVTKTWNSTIGFSGIFKKISVLILIGLAGGVEYILIYTGQSPDGWLVLAVASFFIVNEGLSVIENCAQLGLPVPPVLYMALEKLHRTPDYKESKIQRSAYLDEADRKYSDRKVKEESERKKEKK